MNFHIFKHLVGMTPILETLRAGKHCQHFVLLPEQGNENGSFPQVGIEPKTLVIRVKLCNGTVYFI